VKRTDLEGSRHRRDWLSGHGIDLAAIRNATGPTQVELAAKLGVGQTAVSKIERQSEMLIYRRRFCHGGCVGKGAN
jgi:transcriptional regulator